MNDMPREKMTEATAAAEAPEAKSRPRWLRPVLMLVVPLLLLAAGGWYWLSGADSVSTDNAQVKQDIVSISAQVSGPVVEVGAREGQHVKRGDLLFRIDPAPYRVALEQAEAQLAAARLQERQVRTQASTAGVDIAGAEANLAIQRRALSRQAELLRQGFTTKARYDDALSEVQKAQTQLADARARQTNDSAAVAPGEQPSVAAAQAAVDEARLDLQHTEVRAPMAGEVANADKLQVGQTVVPGIGMLSLVHGDDAWVEANFKEKDLARMAPGEPATISIDAYPGARFKGHVASIGAGTGSEFSLIPAQNANGNWVKVTQRVPVRIAFDGDPNRPMIAGLSAVVEVEVE